MTFPEPPRPDLAAALRELEAALGTRFSIDDEALREASGDFGGFVSRRPLAIVSPISAEEVVAILTICHRTNVPVAIGGAGHSQHGQSLGLAVKLDMRRMNRVSDVDREARTVTVEGGAIWSDVVQRTYAVGRLPVILTNNVGTSVAGTLGMGGIGSASFRSGAQVDHVESLQVVTGNGELCSCSRNERPELFDAMRAGLGQCAVIVAATLRLRPCGSHLSSFTAEYTDTGEAFADLERLASTPSVDHLWMEYRARLEGDDIVGIPTIIVGFEHGTGPSPDLATVAPWLGGVVTSLGTAAVWNDDGNTTHPFFSLRPRGSGAHVNPWVDVMVPADDATAKAQELFPAVTDLLELGICAVTPILVHENAAPLLVADNPPGTLLLTFGLYFTFSPEAREAGALELMGALASMLRGAGRHYLSGYVPLDHAGWVAHYGCAWPAFAASKRQHDPHGILNGLFLAWS